MKDGKLVEKINHGIEGEDFIGEKSLEMLCKLIDQEKKEGFQAGYKKGKQETFEASKSLIVVAEALDDFKYKAYSMMPKIKTNRQYKDFIMSNAPCSYDLRMIISELKKKAGVA